jgi:hypothetical protein
MTAQELEDVYSALCYRLTAVGEANTPMVLARLALLMMHKIDDAAAIAALIDDASDGFVAPKTS